MPSIKELYKRLNDVKIDADSINLNTDGLESLLATTQADIALIKADLANGVAVNQPVQISSSTLSSIDNGVNNIIGTSDAVGSSITDANGAKPSSVIQVGGNDGTNLRALNVDSSGRPNVNINGTVPVSGTFFQATQPISGSVTANAGTGTFAVSASSLPLPTGASTSANQTTANTSLANIDADIGSTSDSAATTDSGTFSLISLFKRLLSTKIPDQASGRIPVTLSSAGTNGSTAPTTSNLFGGTDGTNLRAISTDASGRINTNINGTVPVSGTFWQATQPVSGSVTALSSTGTITNRSSTITTGGTSQQVAASNTSRKYFAIQNISDTAMYLGVGYTPTSTTGMLLSANGGGFVFETAFVTTQAINILCATTGKAFVAWEG